MIEFCSRKRMVAAIVLLLGVTVLTVIMEGMWSTNHTMGMDSEKGPNETQCAQAITMVKPCHPCTSFDLTRGSNTCTKTGYQEQIKCGSKTITRSCRMDPWVEEKKFWLFQLVTLFVGLGSFGVVRFRQSRLDKQLTEKVNRQIAA